MFRFSIKDLLISTALIAPGIAYIGVMMRLERNAKPPMGDVLAVLLWIGTFAAIGAGVFNLFTKLWIGALATTYGRAKN